jgi:hypothetical protein
MTSLAQTAMTPMNRDAASRNSGLRKYEHARIIDSVAFREPKRHPSLNSQAMAFGHHNPEPQNMQSPSNTTFVDPALQHQQHGHQYPPSSQEALQRPTRGHGGLGGHRKMTAGRWFRLYAVDLITMAAMVRHYTRSSTPFRQIPLLPPRFPFLACEIYQLTSRGGSCCRVPSAWACILLAQLLPETFLSTSRAGPPSLLLLTPPFSSAYLPVSASNPQMARSSCPKWRILSERTSSLSGQPLVRSSFLVTPHPELSRH